ncbi:MAG: M28 family peptidase, partial [Thermoleophilaceae bacterium]|nr:M28 family peptidase [Thermoleophilaceae bacterium]
APQTGVLFDQSLLIKAYDRWPEFVAARKSSPPQWWIALVAPLLAVIGLLTDKRAVTAVGVAAGALGTASLVDIMRSPTVPGANDNLSGVAVLTALAQMLRDQPVDGLEVWLVSCGAEETLQDGIRAFVARHRAELDDGETFVLNCDTVGSPHLVMLEGEGPFWMEDYADPRFRDLVAQSAAADGIELERGLRARSSTDSIIPSRAGWPTATLVSITDWRGLANYHLMSDTPDKIDYSTVADATQLAYATAVALANSQAT